MIKIVSKLFILLFCFFFIVESFKILFQEKKHFYLTKNNNNRLDEVEEKRIKTINKRYHLEGIYYDLDNHNIFKRIDRYRFKIIFIILFASFVAFNLFEIGFNIYSLINLRKSENYDWFFRVASSIISLLHILVILILSSITIIKRKINSLIFY